ncbi:MAG: VacJ family lipoprotein [Caldimonas sp.]|uniref:MlaA family lipoprotein n=1 Tax=Caldimonas sp. TaxID=2838790 RepID=UPI00391B98DF
MHRRPYRLILLAATVGLAAGCATTHPNDPLEPLNRKVFAFNEAVDRAVLEPTARAYRDVVPGPVRKGVSNFFGNIGDLWSAVNSFLQLKIENGLHSTLRVGLNTFFGFGGVLDIASEAGLRAEPEDFGQTLGHWGLGPGPYLVLPFLGPSTLRDTAALPLDMQATTTGHLTRDAATAYGLTGLRVVDTRSRLLSATRMLDDVALDKYLFTRDAWLQRRRNLVYDGNPPPQDEEDWDGEDDAAAPAPPASAP